MAVDAVTSATTTTTTKASTTDAKSTSLDYSAFLQLLIAQMKNQDPTDPMDASEQISQLATFSQVEQSVKTNSHLESLLSQNNLNSAASYIGQTVTSLDGSTSGVVASVKVTSDGIVATTTTGKTITIGEGVTIGNATASLSDVSTLIGKTLTDTDGNATGKVVAVTVTSEGVFATTADGTLVPIEEDVTITSTVSTTGYDGTAYLGKTITSADGTVSGVVESVTATADGVFAMTTDEQGIAIEKGVTIKDTTA